MGIYLLAYQRQSRPEGNFDYMQLEADNEQDAWEKAKEITKCEIMACRCQS